MTARSTVEHFLHDRVRDPAFSDALAALLIEFCSIDSTPKPDISELQRQEQAVFDLIRRSVAQSGMDCELLRRPIDHRLLQGDESYTPPYYTQSEDPYRDRANLIVIAAPQRRGSGERSIAVNAHVDTVHPHVPPKRRGERIIGRGACDDKGNVVAMLGALFLIGEIERKFGIKPAGELVLMFVVDEEPGGNGSLALALDTDLRRRYRELVVLECCDNVVYPANRGAIWYKIEIPPARVHRPLIVASQLVLALEEMGREIKRESEHPLFPDRPVQTCHGIWGPWGEHPSRVCGYVELTVRSGSSEGAIRNCVEGAIDRYCTVYGDKTTVIRDGAPVVPWHYRLYKRGDEYHLQIMGSTGHMAAVDQNDGALTKAAYIIDRLSVTDPQSMIALRNHNENETLVLEGGQSFLPTHSLRQIRERIRQTCNPVLCDSGLQPHEVSVLVTMDKLHNAAFCSDPDSDLFMSARRIAEQFDLPQPAAPRGWSASCDARIFAGRYPQMPIITMGAGNLDNAHADDESVGITEVAQNVGAVTLLLLDRSGAFPG